MGGQKDGGQKDGGQIDGMKIERNDFKLVQTIQIPKTRLENADKGAPKRSSLQFASDKNRSAKQATQRNKRLSTILRTKTMRRGERIGFKSERLSGGRLGIALDSDRMLVTSMVPKFSSPSSFKASSIEFFWLREDR